MLKKIIKGVFSGLLIGAITALLGYMLGFLSSLFKAIETKPFKAPSTQPEMVYAGLLDWEHLRYALGIVGVLVLIIIGIAIKFKLDNRNHDDRNFSVSKKGTYGTARYMKEREAKKLLTADNRHSLLTVCREIEKEDDGIIIGKFPNGKIVMKNAIPKENMNLFVCGAPGTGKSYMFVRPYLAQSIKRGESFVCTDPSGELLETMGGYAKECGYKVKVFNLVDPERSDSWNVTEEVGVNQLLAQICVSTIIKNTLEGERPDPFWDNGEKNLLKALLLYINSDAYTGEKSLGSLYKLLADDKFAENTLTVLKNLDANHPAKLSYNIYAQATESVQQSFASGLATRLQIFQSESIRNMTGYKDIDMAAPGKEKCAYFVVISDQDSTYQLLSSLFFSFLFIKLASYGKTCPGQSMPVHVNIVLDELPSIGNIPDLGRRLATVRKYGVNVVPIIQLISQLDNRYSPAERDEIIGCCDTQIWLGSNDNASAEVLSERSGTMTVEVASKTEKVEMLASTQLTESVGKRPVLTVDEVLRIPPDEQVIVLRGQNIMKLKKYRFDEYPDYKNIISAEPITISNYVPDISSKYLNLERRYASEPEPYQYQMQPKPEPAPVYNQGNPDRPEKEQDSKTTRRKSKGFQINE